MYCPEKIKRLSRQIEQNEEKIKRLLENESVSETFEFKKLVKGNINDKIERFILQRIEEFEPFSWQSINSSSDIISKLSNMADYIDLNDEFETRIVGKDYILNNSTRWSYVKQFLPQDLLNKIEPIVIV